MVKHNNIFQQHRKIKHNEHGQVIIDRHDMSIELGGLLSSRTVDNLEGLQMLKTYKTTKQVRQAIKQLDKLYDTTQVEIMLISTTNMNGTSSRRIFIQDIGGNGLAIIRKYILTQVEGDIIRGEDL